MKLFFKNLKQHCVTFLQIQLITVSCAYYCSKKQITSIDYCLSGCDTSWKTASKCKGHEGAYDEDDDADQWQCGTIAEITSAAADFTLCAGGLAGVRQNKKIAFRGSCTFLAIGLNRSPIFLAFEIALAAPVLARCAFHLLLDACTVIPTFGTFTAITLQATCCERVHQ